jgi:hypothetical protein
MASSSWTKRSERVFLVPTRAFPPYGAVGRRAALWPEAALAEGRTPVVCREAEPALVRAGERARAAVVGPPCPHVLAAAHAPEPRSLWPLHPRPPMAVGAAMAVPPQGPGPGPRPRRAAGAAGVRRAAERPHGGPRARAGQQRPGRAAGAAPVPTRATVAARVGVARGSRPAPPWPDHPSRACPALAPPGTALIAWGRSPPRAARARAPSGAACPHAAWAEGHRARRGGSRPRQDAPAPPCGAAPSRRGRQRPRRRGVPRWIRGGDGLIPRRRRPDVRNKRGPVRKPNHPLNHRWAILATWATPARDWTAYGWPSRTSV